MRQVQCLAVMLAGDDAVAGSKSSQTSGLAVEDAALQFEWPVAVASHAFVTRGGL